MRSLGVMNGTKILMNKKNPQPKAGLAKAIIKRCHEKRLIMLRAGFLGNVIRDLVPPVATDELLERGLRILEEAIAEQPN